MRLRCGEHRRSHCRSRWDRGSTSQANPKRKRERRGATPGAVGERGFEPPTSASRTLRANRAALLPASVEDTIGHSYRQFAPQNAIAGSAPTLVANNYGRVSDVVAINIIAFVGVRSVC